MTVSPTNPRVELEERLRFETLIADLSSKFINVPAGEVDRGIEDAQRKVCECLGLDLSALWQWADEAPRYLRLTHLYRPLGGPPTPERFDSRDKFPWCVSQLLDGKIVSVTSMESLPPAAARDQETWHYFGIKSNLTFPLSAGGGQIIGALSFNSTRKELAWPEEIVKRLQLVAQIFASALARKVADQSLRESEARLTLAADSAGAGLWVLDCHTQVFWVTEKARMIFGYSRDEVINMERFKASVHPDDWHLVQQNIERCLDAGEPVAVEYRIGLGDGRTRWIGSQGKLHRASAGGPDRLMGVSVDITDRKRAEEAFRASEARLAAGADLAGLGYFEVDYAGRTYFLDDRFLEVSGIPSKLPQGLDPVQFFLEHIHPEDRQVLLDKRQQMHDGKIDRISAEYRYLHPAKGQRWLHHLTRVATRDAAGRAVRTFGVVRDISERKEAEEALREAQTTLNAIIDSTEDLIWSVDPHSFGLMTFNQGLRDYFLQGRGIRIEPGMGPEVLFPPGEYVERWRDFYQRALQEGSYTTEYLTYTHTRTLQLGFNVLRRDGKVFGVSVFGKDITERKRVELEVQQQRQELAHVARVSVVGELAASVAHELNQPLGAILSNAEAAELFLQQNPPALDELGAILADIRRDDERAGEIIRRMRSLLRKHELEREPLQITPLVEDVFRLVSADAALRKTAISAELSPSVPLILGDRVHLQQVLLNLIMNALESMTRQPPETRRLTVRTRLANKGEVELAVTDSGPGIKPDDMPRIFEPFFTTKESGMGMGLAIARKIVEAHRGRIGAENSPGGGAIFRVILPASAEGMKL